MTAAGFMAEATFVDRLLAEERELTAVDRFSRAHDAGALPDLSPHYRSLIPLSTPRPGEQYAFEVDLDKCSGCKACVTACHAMNGLDETETWRGVGLLSNEDASMRHVTTACHHCVDPGCLNGCPVLAYDKDPTTGIVRHLDDQCIGCQYCVMMCPYEVPKYSHRLGIVRKCDMCSQRLGVGEAPACVQACPNEAIRITLVESGTIRENFRAVGKDTSIFLPDSPPPEITLPTTRFKSNRDWDGSWSAADAKAVTSADLHLPLVFMLVFSQLSVGCLLVGSWIGDEVGVRSISVSLVALCISLASGTAHLGQPLRAWRVFLGWRTSWLSRELMVFGTYAASLAALGATRMLEISSSPLVLGLLHFVALGSGLLGVFSSAMLYAHTRRPFWSLGRNLIRFLGTTLLLGLSGFLVLAQLTGGVNLVAWKGAVMGTLFIKIVLELWLGTISIDWRSSSSTKGSLKAESIGPIRRLAVLRLAVGGLGMGLISASEATHSPEMSGALVLAGIVSVVAGELLERSAFFRGVIPFKMPGGVVA